MASVATPIVVQREQAGLGTPSSVVTAQTVQKMCEHIRNAKSDPIIRNVAAGLKRTRPFRSVAPSSVLCSLWYWVKLHVKFSQDDTLIRKLFNESGHYELLISPPVLLRMKRPQGDCDDFTMLICALCSVLGIDSRIVTLMCDRRRPGEYSHVFPIGYMADKQMWCPVDASHGDYPGWQVPQQAVTRRTEWDLNGNIVSDSGGPQ